MKRVELNGRGVLRLICLGLVFVLLLTAVPAAKAQPSDPAADDTTEEISEADLQELYEMAEVEEAQPTYLGGSHEHEQAELFTATVELKGEETQLQQGIEAVEQNQRLYLPLIQQGEEASAAVLASAQQATQVVDLKVLVIAADGNETDYPAITAFLSQLGIPYTTLLAAQTPLTAGLLSDGASHGYYQGIILTTGNLSYFNSSSGQWESAFDQGEWNTLWAYEAAFRVRQVTSYTYPSGWPDNYGLNLVSYQDTSTTPLNASLTPAGQQVFGYLKPTSTSNPFVIKNAWVYLATVLNPAVTTPLLTAGTYAIASITTYPDGRQNLAVTAANNPYLLHSLLLSYGTINWVTKGLFLGERHVYINPQVDDLLIDSDMWDIAAQSDTTGRLFRLTGSDYALAILWQLLTRLTYPLASNLRLEMAFNAEGASGIYSPDSLTSAVKRFDTSFAWLNHTYTHANLDAISYADALTELQLNHQAATAANQLRLANYYQDAMVQPDISGLYNAEFQRAAKDFGIKYLISDTSQPGWNNPTPNAGFYSGYQPSILIIPRRPTNLFYNLSTPAEWVSEYNCFYGPEGTCAGGVFRYWDHNLTYAEILDKESETWLQYLLKWDIDPLMFHQANLRGYNRNIFQPRSLLGDLIEATLAKYSKVYNLKLVSINQHNIGIKMTNRMAYNAAGVSASLTRNTTTPPTCQLTLTAVQPALIPVTGLAYGTNKEVYGGQNISYIQLAANQSLNVPLTACP